MPQSPRRPARWRPPRRILIASRPRPAARSRRKVAAPSLPDELLASTNPRNARPSPDSRPLLSTHRDPRPRAFGMLVGSDFVRGVISRWSRSSDAFGSAVSRGTAR